MICQTRAFRQFHWRHFNPVVLLLVLFVSACGDKEADDPAVISANTDSPAARAPADPCDLVTNEEMSELIGNPVQATHINATLCEYSPPEGTGISADVFVNTASAPDCDLELSMTGFHDDPAVDGLGVAAHWKLGGSTHQLGVCTGEVFMTITLYQLPGSDKMTGDMALASARGIAETALSH